jgi:ABC-type Mn2+/Zn2+ transport system permease subunit
MKYSLGTLLVVLMFAPALLAAMLEARARQVVGYAVLLWIPVILVAVYVFSRRP